jgi:hypothetical protein
VRALLAVLLVLAASRPAHADKPTLAALAPAADARRAIAIGPAGQIYEPDGKGVWVRMQAGGTTEEIVSATSVAGTVLAGARGAPPFKLKRGAWSALHLGLKARVLLGNGSRATAAVGPTVFALDKLQPVKLADAPSAVLALAASPTGIVVQTDKGLLRFDGVAFKPIKKAPKRVRTLISDRWALVDNAVIDLRTMKKTALPSGIHIVETVLVGDAIVAVSQHGKTVELVTVKRGKVTREKVEIDAPKPIVGLVVDKQSRVAIAMRDGRIALRDGATWTVTEVRQELAPVKPGPAPAESQ